MQLLRLPSYISRTPLWSKLALLLLLTLHDAIARVNPIIYGGEIMDSCTIVVCRTIGRLLASICHC